MAPKTKSPMFIFVQLQIVLKSFVLNLKGLKIRPSQIQGAKSRNKLFLFLDSIKEGLILIPKFLDRSK